MRPSWLAPLVDDESSHDLEPLDRELLQTPRQCRHGVEVAVDAESDLQAIATRGQVQVARPGAVRLEKQGVHQSRDLLGVAGDMRGKRRLDPSGERSAG